MFIELAMNKYFFTMFVSGARHIKMTFIVITNILCGKTFPADGLDL